MKLDEDYTIIFQNKFYPLAFEIDNEESKTTKFVTIHYSYQITFT
jgi:hypothetical protein